MAYSPRNINGQKTSANSAPVVIASDQSALNVVNTGTFAVQATGSTAHDAVDAGSPQKIGFKAKASPKGLTTVADNDRTDAYSDVDGIQMVKLNTSFTDVISDRATDTSGNSTAFTNFSAVAGTRNYVTAITVFNTSAVPGYVDFRDGATGAVLWSMPLPAGGGSTLSSATPLFKTSVNTALAFDGSAAMNAIYVSVSGFQSKA